MKKRSFFLVFVFIILLFLIGFFYFRNQVYHSYGNSKGGINFQIIKGDGVKEIGINLEKEDLISGKIFFYLYVKAHDFSDKMMPGEYNLSGSMTIPEIVHKITTKKDDSVRITFPEGWGMDKMAERLNENGLDGKGFLEISNNQKSFEDKYSYLKDKKNLTLEGYLFPDTYFFKKETQAEEIVAKLLDNFDKKINEKLKEDIEKQNKTLEDIIIMASIIEMEVKDSKDRRLVSGIFWNRMKIGMPLQSDITLTYALGVKKKQYSLEDTRFDSPYNTYKNKGLPPGPINNPGIDAILASIYPENSPYLYFLSNPETGETVFSKNFEEHVVNKKAVGL
jgi:UPF0755 protein